MKVLLLLTIVALLSLNMTAQITLEHTFQKNVYAVNTHQKTVFYTVNGSAFNQVSIYNDDYSLYKIVTVVVPTNYKIQTISNVTDNLFNTDNLIEFTCTFYDTVAYSGYKMKLFDENGTELKDFGNAYFAMPHKTITNDAILYVLRYTNFSAQIQETDIYSLAGTVPASKSGMTNNQILNPYPNPAKHIVNLPYTIGKDDVENLYIYNLNGQLIETKKIGGAFNKILLDVTNYASGQYIYNYKAERKSFIVE